jgi:hypothetical protein
VIDPNTLKAVDDGIRALAQYYSRLVGPCFTMPIDARCDAKLSSSMFWSEEEATRKQHHVDERDFSP